MIFTDYSWEITPPESPRLRSSPDRNRFLNSEGHEVLYLINVCAEATGRTSAGDCRRMEELLHEELPIGVMSQVTAIQWLYSRL